MLDVLIAACAGALINRYRGGLFEDQRNDLIASVGNKHIRSVLNLLFKGDTVNALAFALFCYLAHAGALSGQYILAFMFIQFVMMYRGATPGWGAYIGAAGGWKKDLLIEVEYIDQFIEGLKDRPRLWGVVGLSIRFAEWGLFIGAPLVAIAGVSVFLPVLAGALAGPIVYVLSKVIPQKYVWPVFEYLIGAVLWVSCL